MQQNIKQHTLTFEKGITNSPSDMLSTEHELAECVNLTYDNGEIKPIQKPKDLFGKPLKITIDGKDYILSVTFVHNFHKVENYICLLDTGTERKYVWFSTGNDVVKDNIIGTVDIGKTANVHSLGNTLAPDDNSVFNAIGNTIILKTAKGLEYFLWKNETYKSLGGDMPEIKMDIITAYDRPEVDITYENKDIREMLKYNSGRGHDQPIIFDANGNIIQKNTRTDEIPKGGTFAIRSMTLGYGSDTETHPDVKSAVQDYARGDYAGMENLYQDKNRFLYPFWVRYAVRLYDGTHTHISQPMLMLPSVRRNGAVIPVVKKNRENVKPLSFTFQPSHDVYKIDSYALQEELSDTYWKALVYPSKLIYRLNQDLSVLDDWKDIIKGIDIYVSQEVKTFDASKEWTLENPPFADTRSNFADRTSWAEYQKEDATTKALITDDLRKADEDNWHISIVPHITPQYFSDKEIIKKLEKTSTFFELSRIELSELEKNKGENWNDVPIEEHVVKNITTQSQLEHDDYFSHTKYLPDVVFTYNSRFHLANVERSVFKGFTDFMPLRGTLFNEQPLTIFVRIETSSGTRFAVTQCAEPYDMLAVGYYFYYPDPNAKQVYFCYKDNAGMAKMVTFELKEHSNLNGAYYLGRLPDGTANQDIVVQDDTITSFYEANKEIFSSGEYLPNQVFNTEVNNPFVINAANDNAIGNGTIIGLAANTYALSQGQAGQHPLIIFTTEGVYAMSVASDGSYTNIFNLSREVCNNPKSITETDGAIYFTTGKGLMVMIGTQISLVSLMLSGKNWKRFTSENNILKKVASEKEDDTPFLDYLKDCFIAYNYKKAMLWIANKGYKYHWVFNMRTKTFSRMENDEINNVVNFYPDTLLQTKDGNVFSFQGTPDINDDENTYSGTFVTRPLKFDGALLMETIYQIRNMFLAEGTLKLTIYGSNDMKDWNRLSSITGKPWKYYTFEYNISGWKATDTFTASVVMLQPRRTETLR